MVKVNRHDSVFTERAVEQRAYLPRLHYLKAKQNHKKGYHVDHLQILQPHAFSTQQEEEIMHNTLKALMPWVTFTQYDASPSSPHLKVHSPANLHQAIQDHYDATSTGTYLKQAAASSWWLDQNCLMQNVQTSRVP